MKSLRVVLIGFLACCFLQINAGAQTEKQGAQPPTRLALEVTYSKGTRPAYQPVPNNVWYGGFRTIEGWKPREDTLPVQAVCVGATVEGAAVRVVVSVYTGKKMFEKKEAVGSYLMHENERLTVQDMTAFGLEPFELMVIRVEPKGDYVLPAVTSNANSIEVAEIQAVDATFPTLKLKLQNNSKKNVTALFIEMFVNGRLRVSAMPHNRDGAPLILAGETYEYKRQLNDDVRQTNVGFAPETAPNQSLVIKTAVFDDGTYEGDATTAARFRAFALGRRTQLARLINIYNEALKAEDVPTALGNLRERVNALRTEVGVPALAKLVNDFPQVTDTPTLIDSIEIVMFELKKDTLTEIDRFSNQQAAAEDREALRAWLKENRDRFQKWHDYLNKL